MKKYLILFITILTWSCKETVWEPLYNDEEQMEIDTKILEDYMKSHCIINFKIEKITNDQSSIFDELGGKLKKLDNGVFYYEYEKGKGNISPIDNDTIISKIKIYYEGRTINDNIFNGYIPENISERDTVDSHEFYVSNLIKGWKSSVPLMTMGKKDTIITPNSTDISKNDTIIRFTGTGKSIIFIPSRLAYGVTGNLPLISYSECMIFRIDLESVANQISK